MRPCGVLVTEIGVVRKAVREGGTCVDRARHAELVDLCQNVVISQSAQVDQRQQWLCEWYDRCRGPQQAA